MLRRLWSRLKYYIIFFIIILILLLKSLRLILTLLSRDAGFPCQVWRPPHRARRPHGPPAVFVGYKNCVPPSLFKLCFFLPFFPSQHFSCLVNLVFQHLTIVSQPLLPGSAIAKNPNPAAGIKPGFFNYNPYYCGF